MDFFQGLHQPWKKLSLNLCESLLGSSVSLELQTTCRNESWDGVINLPKYGNISFKAYYTKFAPDFAALGFCFILQLRQVEPENEIDTKTLKCVY